MPCHFGKEGVEMGDEKKIGKNLKPSNRKVKIQQGFIQKEVNLAGEDELPDFDEQIQQDPPHEDQLLQERIDSLELNSMYNDEIYAWLSLIRHINYNLLYPSEETLKQAVTKTGLVKGRTRTDVFKLVKLAHDLSPGLIQFRTLPRSKVGSIRPRWRGEWASIDHFEFEGGWYTHLLNQFSRLSIVKKVKGEAPNATASAHFLNKKADTLQGITENLIYDAGSEFRGEFEKAIERRLMNPYVQAAKGHADVAMNERRNQTIKHAAGRIKALDPDLTDKECIYSAVSAINKRPTRALKGLSPFDVHYGIYNGVAARNACNTPEDSSIMESIRRGIDFNKVSELAQAAVEFIFTDQSYLDKVEHLNEQMRTGLRAMRDLKKGALIDFVESDRTINKVWKGPAKVVVVEGNKVFFTIGRRLGDRPINLCRQRLDTTDMLGLAKELKFVDFKALNREHKVSESLKKIPEFPIQGGKSSSSKRETKNDKSKINLRDDMDDEELLLHGHRPLYVNKPLWTEKTNKGKGPIVLDSSELPKHKTVTRTAEERKADKKSNKISHYEDEERRKLRDEKKNAKRALGGTTDQSVPCPSSVCLSCNNPHSNQAHQCQKAYRFKFWIQPELLETYSLPDPTSHEECKGCIKRNDKGDKVKRHEHQCVIHPKYDQVRITPLPGGYGNKKAASAAAVVANAEVCYTEKEASYKAVQESGPNAVIELNAKQAFHDFCDKNLPLLVKATFKPKNKAGKLEQDQRKGMLDNVHCNLFGEMFGGVSVHAIGIQREVEELQYPRPWDAATIVKAYKVTRGTGRTSIEESFRGDKATLDPGRSSVFLVIRFKKERSPIYIPPGTKGQLSVPIGALFESKLGDEAETSVRKEFAAMTKYDVLAKEHYDPEVHVLPNKENRGNVIASKLLTTLKLLPDGTIRKVKGRHISRGDIHPFIVGKESINDREEYERTDAATARIESIIMVALFCLRVSGRIMSMDFSSAFLQGQYY